MVPERGSVPSVIQYHTYHPLLNLIRCLWIEEDTEVTLQGSILYIFFIGLIQIPFQTLIHYPRLWIDVSQFFQRIIKTTPLLCPAYSISPLLWWGTLKCTLIFIIFVFIDEVHHLRFYHLRIHPLIRRKIWYNLRSHLRFKAIILIICKPCPRHICVYHTSNIAVNRDVILLLPYYHTKKQYQQL